MSKSLFFGDKKHLAISPSKRPLPNVRTTYFKQISFHSQRGRWRCIYGADTAANARGANRELYTQPLCTHPQPILAHILGLEFKRFKTISLGEGEQKIHDSYPETKTETDFDSLL